MTAILVRDYMSKTITFLAPESTIQEAILLMMERKIRHLPILSDGKLQGMVTDRDLKRATPSLLDEDMTREKYQQVLNESTLSDFMVRTPITIRPDQKILEAVKILRTEKIGGLPVVENGKPIGMITEMDLLRAFQEILESSS
tara:strand:- start:76 stop:504 length:429 start_codon:yes stop_codon:yes gene_type:complete